MNWFTDTIEGVTPENWDTIVEFFKADEGFKREHKAYFKTNSIKIEFYYKGKKAELQTLDFEVLFDEEGRQIRLTYPFPWVFILIIVAAILIFIAAAFSFFFPEIIDDTYNTMRYIALVGPWIMIFFSWAQFSSFISQFRNRYYFRMVATVEEKA